MRVGILTPTQSDTDRPDVWTSVTLARQHIADGTAIQIGNGKLRFIRLVRLHARPADLLPSPYAASPVRNLIVNKPCPELCSPNECLDLNYPEAMRVTVHSVHPGFSRRYIDE